MRMPVNEKKVEKECVPLTVFTTFNILVIDCRITETIILKGIIYIKRKPEIPCYWPVGLRKAYFVLVHRFL